MHLHSLDPPLFRSVLQPSSIRGLSSVILIDSSTESPVHVLMLSIQAVRGLPRLRAPGIVPCIIGENQLRMEIVFYYLFCVSCKSASILLPVDMTFYPFLFLSVILSLPYGPSLLTLLHECESSRVLVYLNGTDSFVHFSIVLF